MKHQKSMKSKCVQSCLQKPIIISWFVRDLMIKHKFSDYLSICGTSLKWIFPFFPFSVDFFWVVSHIFPYINLISTSFSPYFCWLLGWQVTKLDKRHVLCFLHFCISLFWMPWYLSYVFRIFLLFSFFSIVPFLWKNKLTP